MAEYLILYFLGSLIESIPIHFLTKRNLIHVLGFVFIIQAVTYPFALLLLLMLNVNYFIVELVVIFVEGLLIFALFKQRLEKSLLISLLANTLTMLLGLFFYSLI